MKELSLNKVQEFLQEVCTSDSIYINVSKYDTMPLETIKEMVHHMIKTGCKIHLGHPTHKIKEQLYLSGHLNKFIVR